MLQGKTKLGVAHKWAPWLHNPCRPGGSPMLQSVRQSRNWPTSEPNGYIIPAIWGVPCGLERRKKSEGAHKWDRWLHNPSRPGGVPYASQRGTKSEVAHKWAHCYITRAV